MSAVKVSPMRFPRVYAGDAASALASILRSHPVFKVELPRDKRSVVFSYEFSVPEQIPPEFLDLYEVLFIDGRDYWEEAVVAAKKEAEEGKKRELGRVHNFHRSILTESFKTWLFDSWGLRADYIAQRKEHLERFKKDSALARGTKPDAGTAFMAAIRFRQLDGKVREVLHRLKAKPSHAIKKVAQVKEEIKRSELSQELFRRALTIIYGEGTEITFMELLTPRLRHERVARAMVSSELKVQGWDLDLISADTYIDYGTRLLDVLDEFNKG